MTKRMNTKKKKLVAIFGALAAGLLGVAYAGSAISPSDMPEPVNRAIGEYFPGATAVSAKKDLDDGLTKYEVKLSWKDLALEVELSPEGKILDLDM